MAIGNAVQSGNYVKVYDEHGKYLTSHSGELYGYTPSIISIKVGSEIQVFDESGKYLASDFRRRNK